MDMATVKMVVALIVMIMLGIFFASILIGAYHDSDMVKYNKGTIVGKILFVVIAVYFDSQWII